MTFYTNSKPRASSWWISTSVRPQDSSHHGAALADVRLVYQLDGSGVVEAGCKTVIGRRLKMSGMFWTVRGANSLIALRCNRISGKFTDYGESRAA